MLNDDQLSESPFKSKESQLNNSIRKKLFDHNSEDSSTATTTTTTTPIQSVLLTKLKSADLSALKQQSGEQSKRISQLPKPEIFSSSDTDNLAGSKQPRTLASSSSSNTDDCWNDSFEFDDHQFASSPKYEKFSHIIHDIGNDIGDDDLNDSVFLTQHHKTPPDLSPLPIDGERFNENSKHTNQINHDINSPLNYESRMHFNFDTAQSASKKTDKAALSSPNLSPIRQQHTAESTNCTLKTSNTKSQNRLNKIKSDNNLVNMSALSQPGAKSIIFMDCGATAADQHDESKENKSFSESILDNEHHNHYKREEFYKQTSFNELETNNNETYREESLKNANKLASTNNIDINKPSMKSQKSSGSTSSSSGNSKPFLLTTMNSMMSETTTNTFNQDSQDTGYQTNSVVNGSNSTTNTNIMMNTNTCNPSMMIMDLTNNQNELTNNYLFLSSTSLSSSQQKFKTNLTTNTVTSSTPMNIEDDNTNNNTNNNNNEKENHFKATYKRPSLDLKQQQATSTTSKNLKIKKNSVSLNSLENIKPLEASTPEVLKFSFNSNSLFKPIVSARPNKTNNELIKPMTSSTTNNRKVNFIKSKTFNLARLNANYLNTNKMLVKEPVVLLATNSANQNVNNNNDNDVSMLSNSSNLVFFSESINENTNSNTSSNTDLIRKKNQLDSIYVEQSILMNKISPSN